MPQKKAHPKYIAKLQTTEPAPQSSYHKPEICSSYRKELDKSAQKPGANWRHDEHFVSSRGYTGGFRPARILQYTLDHMEEYATEDCITIRSLLIILRNLLMRCSIGSLWMHI